MPRISPFLIRQAAGIDKLLPLLLRSCRDLASARNELRWLRDHVLETPRPRQLERYASATWQAKLVRQLVKERASGKPLQYILGTEYFGDLELACRPGVLIPRRETATSVTYLVQRLSRGLALPAELRLLDLCSGSGCIPLLFQHEFSQICGSDVRLQMLGIDISTKAIQLARLNQQRLLEGEEQSLKDVSQSAAYHFRMGTKAAQWRLEILRNQLTFVKGNILGEEGFKEWDRLTACGVLQPKPSVGWDILISNPPYISPTGFNADTALSVRKFEPRIALVPPNRPGLSDMQRGDMFYPRLLDLADHVGAKVVLLEVADLKQALRVAQSARERHRWDGIEIWRDEPALSTIADDAVSSSGVPVLGQGEGRSVFCWRDDAGRWLGGPGRVAANASNNP